MPEKSETRVAFVALGCAKNLVDSEKMLGQLAEAGCTLTSDAADADVVVINTCGFLAAARQEASEVIREMVALKGDQGSRLERVVVAGCLVQRDGEDIGRYLPGVDALVGVHNREDLAKAVRSRGPQGGVEAPLDLFLGPHQPSIAVEGGRLRLTPPHYAYLRISEGCDRACTFCTIPAIRGPMRSKTPPLILEEARELIADGAVELVLIGQDTTGYGGDLGYEPGLAGLLRELDGLEGVKWLRLMYAYPSALTAAALDAMAECSRVVKYVDVPLQHINDRMLKAMGRRVTRDDTERMLERIRRRVPGVSLRTTMIVGFPGESDAEFDELLEFVKGAEFDALGVFPYSLEPDTPAGRMCDQLPDEVKEERAERLMLAQQEIAFTLADRRINQRVEVLVDEQVDDYLWESRHAGQAPEVDSVTLVEGVGISPGEFVEVLCTGRRDYDLLAAPVDERTS